MVTPNKPRPPHAQADEATRQAAGLIKAVERPAGPVKIPTSTIMTSAHPTPLRVKQGATRGTGRQTGPKTPRPTSDTGMSHRGQHDVGTSRGSRDSQWDAARRSRAPAVKKPAKSNPWMRKAR